MEWSVLCACLLLSVVAVSQSAVISIDFGGEWVKVALVKPGVPMEIVINKESKRKTASIVSLRNDERLFGDAALHSAVKHPKSSYRYLQLLVGQKYSSPLVDMYKKWFPWYDIVRDEETGTVLFQHDADTLYSPEELIGMIFNHSRQSAQSFADDTPIRDVVVTVPAFFSQAQRQVMLRCAELVGLNVLQIMSNNAGAALNYGVFRQSSFNVSAQYVMFYDMGALSTTATVVEYRRVQVKEGSVANTYPQLAVKGTGFDRTLGGLQIELRIRDHLAAIFESQKKTTGSVYDSPRAMAKLLKEAKRVKQVLSANNDHRAQIEGLLEDVDFKAPITRKELEEMSADLFERVGGPIQQALEAADMTMDEIDSVILVGGGTRVPKVQETLLQVVNKPELGKSLNTDEAIAMGAVYQAAAHSKLFRVKKFIVKEGTVFPIQVSFTRVSSTEAAEGEEPEEVTKVVKRTLFHRSNGYPQKKVLTFNRYSEDFSFQVFYGDLDFLSPDEKSYLGRLNISEVYLAGVKEALAANTQGEHKGIKAHFRMDESGILFLDNAECVFEYPENGRPDEQSTLSKLSNVFSSFFGGSEEDPQAETEATPSETTPIDTPTPEDKMEASDGNETTPIDDQEEQPRENEQEEESEEEESNDDTSEDDSQNEEESAETTDSEEEPKKETEDDDKGDAGSDEEASEKEESPEKEAESTEKGEESPDELPAGETDTNTTSSETTPLKNSTVGGKSKKTKKTAPKDNMVKVNLTAEVTKLDLLLPSNGTMKISMEKLAALQNRDNEKAANEVARNNLESHIFETKDLMYLDKIASVSTEEQREAVLTVLSEAGEWMEDEGYLADTKTYKDKLRDLRKASRAMFKRAEELSRRPKYLDVLNTSLNISHDFLSRMMNLTKELQIFTEVEMTTLETLVNETEEWLSGMLEQQEATPPHEEPVLLSYEIQERTKRLDREVMYLLNKLRTHPPPKPKIIPTKDNSTKPTTTDDKVVADDDSGVEAASDEEDEPSTESEDTTATQEPLDEPATDDDDGVTDDVTEDDPKHGEL